MKRGHGLILFLGFGISAHSYALSPDQIIHKLGNLNKNPTCPANGSVPNPACDSMSTLSCDQQSYHDGTGKVLTEEEFNSQSLKLMNQVDENNFNDLSRMLQDPDHKYDGVRNLALRSTFKDGDPDCTSSIDPKARKKCLDEVSMSLAKMNRAFDASNVWRSSGTSEVNVNFMDFNKLRNNKVFIEGLSESKKKNIELLVDQKKSKKVEEIFPEVRKILLEKIGSLVTDPSVAKKIKAKIEAITYQGTDCSLLSGTEPLGGYLEPDAFYNPRDNSFRYCNGLLMKSDSEFLMVMTIVHELSHSIDPCWIESPPDQAPFRYTRTEKSTLQDLEDQYPFQGLLACLRSEESVGSLSVQSGNSKPLCEGDQITETFSDWMGTEVLADFVEKKHSKLSSLKKTMGYSNVFRDICKDQSQKFDVHPDTVDRIDRLLMAHPKIRKQIGCDAPKDQLHYCKPGESFRGTRASAKRPRPPQNPSSTSVEDHFHFEGHRH